ncbi:MAG: phosphate ABC transporter substrate-binding protein PstS [Crenarchaeota archaeon]|nr:phosphate ABC transporter substrate-binding protein PstS [Thermoproteota archaeon]HJJ24938.1 phosphate ABC transporter substrate-binding protein PstS [Nitrosopumilus sp.]HJJ26263.1 phosphate ABC transporter substrate-binding protein PstS [Nitrosopumilus sp.]
MNTKTSLLILLTALGAIISPLYADAATTPDIPDPNVEFNLTGAGATFPFPLIDLWRVEYNNVYDNVNLNYQSIGSGGGIKQHIEKTVNFAASDAPMREAERDLASGTLHIPESIGGVVVVYNLPEVPNNGLKLTTDAIAGIFLGEITKWNDPAITAANPGLNLPDKAIVTAHRSDGSGTTFIFTDYLSVVSPTWDELVGTGKSVPWPLGLAAAGNEGVASIVKSTEYSIGYVELAYAFQTGMTYASIQNAEKSAFIEPSLDSISAASSGAADSLPAAKDSWVGVSLVNAPGSESYPIASFTYLLVYDDLKPVTKNKEQAKAVIHLINWMITDGQEYSSSLLYVPLADKVTKLGQQGLKQITYDGEILWDENASPKSEVTQEINQQTEIKTSDEKEGGGCLIATATYGSEMAPQVQLLREIRDNQLMNSAPGMSFMTGFNQLYYSFSPQIADMERANPAFKEMVKIGITPLLSTLSVMEYAESDSEVLGYGVSVILMNLGMYVAAPAMLFYGLTKKYRG